MESSNYEKRYIRLLRQANSHYLVTFFANLLNSFILAYILADIVPHSRLITWLVALVAIVIPRAVYTHYAQFDTYSHARKTGHFYFFGLTLTGMIWGMVSLFLFPEGSLPHQTFIAFVVGGMVVGASVTSAAFKNAFLFFGIPALLPLVIRFFAIGTEITNAMGVMLIVLFFCSVVISRKIHAAIIQTIESSLETEKEIEIRKNAENELRKHQETLEDTITNRTKELYDANIKLAQQIQERKLTERKYQDIFNSTNDAMLIHKASTGKILEVNQAMLEMYGYTREEASTLEFEDLSEGTFPYSRLELAEKFRAAVESGPQIFEWRAKGKNRALFWVEVALKYSEFENGQYIIAVVRNIETRKRDEENQLKVKKLESIGLLAGGIAHDFNNILTAITGNINLALFDRSISSETQKILNEAEKASIRAKDLTQQLLTFSKGGEPIKKTSSLRDVIQDSANFVLHGGKSSCNFHIPDDLYLVDIDQGQISQVVQNIVLNADQAMPNGGSILIACENIVLADSPIKTSGFKSKHVKVKISDSGNGIPARYVDKIFDPYFSTKSKGSGLGLTICQSIINKHNGSISVSSMPGEGSTFTILLPASSQQDMTKTDIKELPTLVTGHYKILVMDDEEQLRTIIKLMLTRMGFDVVLAKDGVEALQLYTDSLHSQAPIDLIIMDLTVPGGMGGKEAARKILEVNSDAKIIVASGYFNDPVMARYKEFGFCAAVEKPYSFQDIKKTIASLLA